MPEVKIPETHPRNKSLNTRHKLINGMEEGIVAKSGLIAHGRGEAFDYLLGEKTHQFSIDAIEAAAAELFLAKHPIICVNGNTAIICAESMINFSNESKIHLEINLFYRSKERITKIENRLLEKKAKYLLGTKEENQIEVDGIDSYRRYVDLNGIKKADVVFVPLEDGDRAEHLAEMGKRIITVDLNPLSRTSQKANVTIVDNVDRVFPLLRKKYFQLNTEKAKKIVDKYNNTKIIQASLNEISKYWKDN